MFTYFDFITHIVSFLISHTFCLHTINIKMTRTVHVVNVFNTTVDKRDYYTTTLLFGYEGKPHFASDTFDIFIGGVPYPSAYAKSDYFVLLPFIDKCADNGLLVCSNGTVYHSFIQIFYTTNRFIPIQALLAYTFTVIPLPLSNV